MVIFVSHISLVVSGRFEWILDGFGTFDILVITHSSTSFPGDPGCGWTQNLGGRKIFWKGGATGFFYCHIDKITKANVLEYPPTLRFWMDRWSRDQPQPGSLFQRLREAEKRDPGNKVAHS